MTTEKKKQIASLGRTALINTSYGDSARQQALEGLVGKKHGFFKSLSLGGTGSPKLRLISAPTIYEEAIMQTSALPSCNVEIRTQGCVIWFRIRHESLAIAIPYPSIHECVFEYSEQHSELGGSIILRLEQDELIQLGATYTVRNNAIRFTKRLQALIGRTD